MRVDWTHEAELALDAIYERILPYSALAARRLVTRLLARTAQLEHHPRMGRVVPEYRLDRFRELIEPPYRIMYQVFADRIEVATIRHSAEALPHLPGESDQE